jgi:hypothetical protein
MILQSVSRVKGKRFAAASPVYGTEAIRAKIVNRKHPGNLQRVREVELTSFAPGHMLHRQGQNAPDMNHALIEGASGIYN